MIKVYGATYVGIEPIQVSISACLNKSSSGFKISGLPETATKELKARVHSAITTQGLRKNLDGVVVQIETSIECGTIYPFGLDLPVALAALIATAEAAPLYNVETLLVFGQLAPDGKVLPVRGAFVMAQASGIKDIICAMDNAGEAIGAWGNTNKVYCVQTLGHLLEMINFEAAWENGAGHTNHIDTSFDFADIQGNKLARRAAEIAVAGFHNIELYGEGGITLVARRMPTIFPPNSSDGIDETTAIYSVAGLNIGGGSIVRAPFRAPHHTTTIPGMIGGGAPVPRPGEISLAHSGVLYLTEVEEFGQAVISNLETCVAARQVELMRATGTFKYPSDCLVVMGHSGKFDSKLVSRTAMCQMSVKTESSFGFQNPTRQESSDQIRARVMVARGRQAKREQLNSRLDRMACRTIVEKNGGAIHITMLSPTKQLNVIRIASTIADLTDSDQISAEMFKEAAEFAK